jgi:hypothetical protein
MVLLSIDSVQVNDLSIRKRLNFHGDNSGFDQIEFDVSWIDGIGSTRGLIPIFDCFVGLTSVSPACVMKLLCHEENGTLLFTNNADTIQDCSLVDDLEFIPATQMVVNFSPNPVKDILNIHFNNKDWENQFLDFQVYNTMGQLVHQQKVWVLDTYQLNLNSSPSGLYWLKINNEKHSITTTIIKQ